MPGATVFQDKCSGCHAVRGTDARGELAPDLTHLMSRSTIAAGALDNDPANLRLWVSKTQAVKPGSEMPTVAMAPAELDALMAYLQTLH